LSGRSRGSWRRAARSGGRSVAAHRPRRDAFERSVPGVSRRMIDMRSDTGHAANRRDAPRHDRS
jgi:hypothetical protein